MDINVIAAVLGMVVTLWGITWKMSKDTDRKIGKMFSRFDEFKEHMEITHTRREVCDIQHTQLKNDLTEIKLDVKTLLKKLKFNGD